MRWLYGGLLQVTDKACCRGCAGFVRSCYCEPTMHREEYNEHACQGQTKPCQPKKKHKRIIALLLHRYTMGSTDNLWGRSPHVAINALKKWLNNEESKQRKHATMQKQNKASQQNAQLSNTFHPAKASKNNLRKRAKHATLVRSFKGERTAM